MNIKKNRYLLLLLTFVLVSSCKKYLDVKPDKALVVPETLEDCENILANFGVMNSNYPSDGEASADNYFITNTSWGALPFQEDKDTYIWAPQGQRLITNWNGSYKTVFYSNVVLETLDKIKPKTNEITKWNMLKGSALFFRAYAFYQIAQVFAKPYNQATAEQDMGIPIRLSSDINEKTTRATLKQSYSQILNDLQQSSQLLPAVASIKSQPNKAASFAALARTFLSMEDYSNALVYADSSLKNYNTLLDYNLVSTTSSNPFSIFNDEVTFQSRSTNSSLLSTSNGKINPDLYASYGTNDLRKVLFFKKNTDGVTFQFKGNYSASTSVQFVGFAVDEMYLIRAECFARAGNTSASLNDLNTLLKTRWKANTFIPFVASNPDEALSIILNERRKELVYRHLRWTDLRRLNKDSRFAKKLTRSINDQIYELPPNDLRYTILIPNSIISQTGMAQNPR